MNLKLRLIAPLFALLSSSNEFAMEILSPSKFNEEPSKKNVFELHIEKKIENWQMCYRVGYGTIPDALWGLSDTERKEKYARFQAQHEAFVQPKQRKWVDRSQNPELYIEHKLLKDKQYQGKRKYYLKNAGLGLGLCGLGLGAAYFTRTDFPIFSMAGLITACSLGGKLMFDNMARYFKCKEHALDDLKRRMQARMRIEKSYEIKKGPAFDLEQTLKNPPLKQN